MASCEVCGMRTGVTIHLGPIDRKRLQTIIDDRNSPQKHVWRARIVLATADGLGTAAIMRTRRRQQDGGLALAGAFHG